MMSLFLLATAVATPAATTNPDLEQMLANTLQIGSTLPGVLGAIFVGLVVVAWAILKIAKYFEERGQREKEAYLEDQRIRKIEAENTARMQKDAVAALIDNMDISYKQDYEYFIQKIKEQKYSAIYAKTAPQFKEQIAVFVYDETQTPEFRSAHIIQVIRKQ